MRTPALFLDRDGVINKLVPRDGGWYSPRRVADFEFNEGIQIVREIAAQLGLKVVVVTNQPDIARGKLDLESHLGIMKLVEDALSPDGIYVCPHDTGDNCECRKPKPGLLRQAIDDLSLSIDGSLLVGDRRSDMLAAVASSITPVLLPSAQTEEGYELWTDCQVVKTLEGLLTFLKRHNRRAT